MSKSFKRDRRWEENDYDDNDYKQKQKDRNRRKMKRMKNDLRSLRNVSTQDLQFYEDDE